MTEEERKIRERTIVECSQIAFQFHKGVRGWFRRWLAEKIGIAIASEILKLDASADPSWKS